MRTTLKMVLLCTGLAMVVTAPASASIRSVGLSDAIVGQQVAGEGQIVGWTSTSLEEGKDGIASPQLMELDQSLVNLEQGGVRFVIERSSGGGDKVGADYEVVLSLSDNTRKTIVAFGIVWEDPLGSVLTVTGVENEKRDGLWPGKIYLGRQVRTGEKLDVMFTWGRTRAANALYVDGRKITYEYFDDGYYIWNNKGSKTFGEFLVEKGFTSVIVGAESPDGVEFWSPLNDTILWALDFYGEPEIISVNHDFFEAAGYSGRLVAGDNLTVTIVAEPDGAATFDLVRPTSISGGITTSEKILASELPMTEDPENPGTYMGSYTVATGDYLEDGVIVGHFVDDFGFAAAPVTSSRPIAVDGTTHFEVNPSNDLIPADKASRSGLTLVATDANGKAVRDRELKLTLSTTDEYTGTVGGGTFEDIMGGTVDVDWGGITDSFGEVTAQYISGFAAKTILISAKDMVSGDVGVGWVRSYIDGTVDIVVTEPKVSALSVTGSMDVSLSRDWLTADGQSRSRITAVVKDASGEPLSGHSVQFTLLGDNGAIRTVQGKTDSRGRAIADYIAGTVMGQVQVEVRDLTSGLTAIVSIELRPDAPAEITLTAEPAEVVTGGQTTVSAKVTDANGNPNQNVDVLYNVPAGNGSLGNSTVPTDEKGNALVTFTAGDTPGLVTVRGTVISREPTAEEISVAKGALFLYGLAEDPGRLDVVEWLAKPGDEVVEGQALVTLEDRAGNIYILKAPRDGILANFTAEERDRVNYGDTLGYVIEAAE